MADTESTTATQWNLIFICWLIASSSALGSLFFSEIMELPPCALCWYQRIFMFPLVIVLFVGMFPFDPRVIKYALPISAVGWATAFFHLLLYTGVIPEDLQPCSQGVSCTEEYISIFGFLSIPMLSLISFTAITVLLIVLKRRTT